jgi:serine/threonine protein kinase
MTLTLIVASWSDNHLSDVVQSPALRAPEVTIGAHWDASIDIWSLGCLVGIQPTCSKYDKVVLYH